MELLKIYNLIRQKSKPAWEDTMEMNNRSKLISGGVVFLTLSGMILAAIGFRRSHRTYRRKFDPASIEERSGKVEDIVYTGRENREDSGVELLLKSGDEFVSVHLGPAWYLERQNGRLRKGEKVIVRGSKILHNHEPVIIAETVARGDKVFRLRDQNGHPVWTAWLDQSK